MFGLMLAAGLSWFPPDDPMATFKEEAPKAWEKYAERARRLQGNLTFTIRSPRENKLMAVHRFELKQRAGCWLFVEQYGVEAGDEVDRRGYVHAINPYYSFKLRRKTSDGPWAAAGVGKISWNAVEEPSRQTEWILRAPYTFSTIVGTLRATLDDPEFSIGKVTPADGDDGQLLKVEFKYSPVKDAGRKPLRRGWVLLDPKRYWVMRAFDAHTLWGDIGREYAARFEYVDTSDGFPILKTVFVTSKTPSKNQTFDYIYSYELQERDVPEREFRVSAFGFPEPAGAPPVGSRWYLWFIGFAFISLGVGWYFWRRVKENRQMPGPASTPRSKGNKA